jgi:hypothetical protein
MYSLGDKYCISSLMELAADKYRDALRKTPDMDDYLSSISEVYLPPPPNKILKDIAVTFGRKNLRTELNNDSVQRRLRVVISDVPEFGYDIVEAFVRIPILGTCANCGSSQVADALQARCRKCRHGGISHLN